MDLKLNRFARYAWGVVAINLIVIVWGGFVRASGSGAGCGAHWPICNGQIIPRTESVQTMIEFSHRVTSGLALLGVIGLLIWAWRAYPAGHVVRTGAAWSMGFMVIEALVGAGLVLLELVAYNVSIARAWWMAGHLLNTFLLMAWLVLTAWWASGGERVQVRGQGMVWTTQLLALIALMVLGMSGAVTALGDTLVLGGGLTAEDSPIVATLIDLRIFHPIIAFVVGAFVGVAAWVARTRRPSAATRTLSTWVGGLYVAQLLLGSLNVALKAPIWLQLVHLALTTTIWSLVVLLAAAALDRRLIPAQGTQPRPAGGKVAPQV